MLILIFSKYIAKYSPQIKIDNLTPNINEMSNFLLNSIRKKLLTIKTFQNNWTIFYHNKSLNVINFALFFFLIPIIYEFWIIFFWFQFTIIKKFDPSYCNYILDSKRELYWFHFDALSLLPLLGDVINNYTWYIWITYHIKVDALQYPLLGMIFRLQLLCNYIALKLTEIIRPTQ